MKDVIKLLEVTQNYSNEVEGNPVEYVGYGDAKKICSIFYLKSMIWKILLVVK